MARITVEDCVDKVQNRFELVLLSAHRARMIANGSPLTVDQAKTTRIRSLRSAKSPTRPFRRRI